MVVGLGKPLQRRLLDNVAKVFLWGSRASVSCSRAGVVGGSVARTDVVFAVFGVPELVNQELYRVGGGAHKAQTAQMAHLLAVDIV